MTEPSENLLKQINELQYLDRAELHAMYRRLNGKPSSCRRMSTLRGLIAYRLQERYYNTHLEEIVEEKIAAIAEVAVPDNERSHALKLQGTTFSRVWHGKRYDVALGPDGKFVYEGRLYRSLSAVAKEITGAQCNGRQFFQVYMKEISRE